MSFIEKFKNQYKPLLDCKVNGAKRGLIEGLYKRGDGFQLMFDLLLASRHNNFEIIETGTLRNPGAWKDGQSAMLFTEFVEQYGGRSRSVDIDQDAVNTARDAITSEQFEVYCSDSVTWLREQSDLGSVDLFYLDSYDVKWQDDTPSAQHHLKEFLSIESYLKDGAVVAIDDNSMRLTDGMRTGKGRMIVEYLERKGKFPLYDAHQIIYQF
jgi:hypothetical protein